jgi:chemotaxis protein histidine kinase CheA
MSGDTGLEDDSLIDLFRSEVETHSESLSAALLALERTPGDTSRIDEMMRAAHSIKGASRVVGVDPAVSVAHVMEDCFVAAQRGTLAFTPADVDVLLRGVDLLNKISAATRNPGADLAREFNALVQVSVAELQGVLSGSGKAPKITAAREGKIVASSPTSAAAKPEAVVSVTQVPAPATSEVTIVLPEVLDSAAAEEFRRRFLSAIDSGCSRIGFDFRATRDLDVQGLALLAAIPPHLAGCGRPAAELAGVSLEMATVLRVTGLAESFKVRPDPPKKAE